MTCCFFFFNNAATTCIYSLSLHDALPISLALAASLAAPPDVSGTYRIETSKVLKVKKGETAHAKVEVVPRSEEHTSELQSRPHLVCRLLLEKKKRNTIQRHITARNFQTTS